MLYGKNILLGVSGSIAAYKSAYLIRYFIKAGAHVKVIMTEAAKDFISPLTLSTLSKEPVLSEFIKDDKGTWNNHVELGLWADFMLIAPASANTLGKMANGICDNLLLATYLSAKCPVYFAPAMDLDMHHHPSTKRNIKSLQAVGNTMIPAEYGELASGLHGDGRMAEPENIINFIQKEYAKQLPLYGQKALVTAGPTYEAIDPVRFIGNHSSGKMGFALAEALAGKGASVKLVCGPTAEKTNNPNIKRVDVVSASGMYEACLDHLSENNIIVMAAAVADYKPNTIANKKIKKTASIPKIELVPTEDILAAIGKKKKKSQFLVGFALETDNEVKNAKDKLHRKNLDLIILNSLKDKGAGFKTDTNKIAIIDKDNNVEKFKLKTKQEVAKDIVNKIISIRYAKN